MAADTPAQAELSPPVIAPKIPVLAPSIAPLASRKPKPDIGIVAPAPAKSTKYS